MRLRPYKRCDAEKIQNWIKEEDVFLKWGGKRFGTFPIDADIINDKYDQQNGDCVEADNFYPWTAIDDEGNAVGHFTMRYVNGDSRQVRFGWVVVDQSARGKGYGKQMLSLGLQYAFDIFGAKKVTIGVFENNAPAHECYKKVGFVDREIVKGDPWNVVEMEILRENRK